MVARLDIVAPPICGLEVIGFLDSYRVRQAPFNASSVDSILLSRSLAKPVSDHPGDAALCERGAAIGGRDELALLDGRAASLLLESKETRVHAAAAFLCRQDCIEARLRFI